MSTISRCVEVSLGKSNRQIIRYSSSMDIRDGVVILGFFAKIHLGDVLCCSLLPRLLTQHRGLTVYVSRHLNSHAVFKNNPYVAGFAEGATLSLRECATGNGHMLQRFLQAFELPIEPIPKPEIYLTAEEQFWARKEREKWPTDRPICILSSKALTDQSNLEQVNWQRVSDFLSRHFTIIQPVLDEKPLENTIVYRGLSNRQYIAIFSAADCFFGGTSGGSHIAAAFDVPAIIVVWESLKQHLKFPISGQGFKESFLYPQQWFIASESISLNQFDINMLEAILSDVARHGRRGRPTPISNLTRRKCGFVPMLPVRVRTINSGRFVRVPFVYGDRCANPTSRIW